MCDAVSLVDHTSEATTLEQVIKLKIAHPSVLKSESNEGLSINGIVTVFYVLVNSIAPQVSGAESRPHEMTLKHAWHMALKPHVFQLHAASFGNFSYSFAIFLESLHRFI